MLTKTHNLKVIVIGLDGATFDLIDKFLEDSYLPTLKRLISMGVRAKARSIIPPVSASAWTSIITGVNPGKHGLFDFSKRKAHSYSVRPVFSTDVKVKTLWSILGEYGYKTIAVKVPGTYPPEKINGVLISGFPTPEEKEDFVYPREVLYELREKFGKFKLQPQTPITDSNEDKFLNEMMEITEIQTEIVRYLMKKYEWDLLFNVFMITDAIPHHFYKYFDENHPLYNSKKAKKYSDAILKSYEQVDNAIAKILKEAPSDAVIFLISDHGFAPVYYAFYSNTWLLKEGYLKIKRKPIPLIKYLLFKCGFNLSSVYRMIKKMTRMHKIEKIAYEKSSFLLKLKDMIFLSMLDIDWERSKAYSLGNFGQIFINLKGREPMGCVDTTQYDSLVEEIILKLKGLKDKYGNVLFDIVLRGKDVYTGPYAEYGADILFMNSKSRYMAIRTMEFGSNKIISVHPVWSGAHTLEGIFVAAGKIIKKCKLSEIKLYDITPTILHLFGIPIPRYMDGQVLDIFKENVAVNRPHLRKSMRSRIKNIVHRLSKEGRL